MDEELASPKTPESTANEASEATKTPEATADQSTANEASANGPAPTGTMSMADYDEAMQDRNVHARARGLSAPYIAGGRDPDPESGRAQERFYLRLLAAMVLLIVVGGLALSIVVYLATGGGQ